MQSSMDLSLAESRVGDGNGNGNSSSSNYDENFPEENVSEENPSPRKSGNDKEEEEEMQDAFFDDDALLDELELGDLGLADFGDSGKSSLGEDILSHNGYKCNSHYPGLDDLFESENESTSRPMVASSLSSSSSVSVSAPASVPAASLSHSPTFASSPSLNQMLSSTSQEAKSPWLDDNLSMMCDLLQNNGSLDLNLSLDLDVDVDLDLDRELDLDQDQNLTTDLNPNHIVLEAADDNLPCLPSEIAEFHESQQPSGCSSNSRSDQVSSLVQQQRPTPEASEAARDAAIQELFSNTHHDHHAEDERIEGQGQGEGEGQGEGKRAEKDNVKDNDNGKDTIKRESDGDGSNDKTNTNQSSSASNAHLKTSNRGRKKGSVATAGNLKEKKEKRRARNRELAAESRNRRKLYMERIEWENKTLKQLLLQYEAEANVEALLAARARKENVSFSLDAYNADYNTSSDDASARSSDNMSPNNAWNSDNDAVVNPENDANAVSNNKSKISKISSKSWPSSSSPSSSSSPYESSDDVDSETEQSSVVKKHSNTAHDISSEEESAAASTTTYSSESREEENGEGEEEEEQEEEAALPEKAKLKFQGKTAISSQQSNSNAGITGAKRKECTNECTEYYTESPSSSSSSSSLSSSRTPANSTARSGRKKKIARGSGQGFASVTSRTAPLTVLLVTVAATALADYVSTTNNHGLIANTSSSHILTSHIGGIWASFLQAITEGVKLSFHVEAQWNGFTTAVFLLFMLCIACCGCCCVLYMNYNNNHNHNHNHHCHYQKYSKKCTKKEGARYNRKAFGFCLPSSLTLLHSQRTFSSSCCSDDEEDEEEERHSGSPLRNKTNLSPTNSYSYSSSNNSNNKNCSYNNNVVGGRSKRTHLQGPKVRHEVRSL